MQNVVNANFEWRDSHGQKIAKFVGTLSATPMLPPSKGIAQLPLQGKPVIQAQRLSDFSCRISSLIMIREVHQLNCI